MINLGAEATQPPTDCTAPPPVMKLAPFKSKARYSGTLAFMWETRLVWRRRNLSDCDSHLEIGIVTTHSPAMPSHCFTSNFVGGPWKAFTQPKKQRFEDPYCAASEYGMTGSVQN